MNQYQHYLLNRSGSIRIKFALYFVLVCGVFGFAFGLPIWQEVLSSKFSYLGLVIALGGGYFGFIKLLEIWVKQIEFVMEKQFDARPENKYFTIRLFKNQDLEHVTKLFFAQLMFSFRSRDTNQINKLVTGKHDLTLTFDFVFENATKNIFATIPHKRVPNFLAASSNHLKGIFWKPTTKNPLDKFSSSKFDGFCISPSKSNLYPPVRQKNTNDIQALFQICKELSKKNTIIIQYCFQFDANITKASYNQEFKKYLRSINLKYNFGQKIPTLPQFKAIQNLIWYIPV
jgi:hypothetical protein